MKLIHALWASAICAIDIVPFIAQAGTIQGTIAGSTVIEQPQTMHPRDLDDANIATTFDVAFLSVSPYIMAGAARFPSYHFVFAGLPPGSSPFAPPVGLSVTAVDPGDFTIDQYKPWVVNNNETTNYVIGPNNQNYDRGVTKQDAGGANIVISYTPRNDGDPMIVNFVQAFVQNTNNRGPTRGRIDNDGGSTPLYNETGHSGTGSTEHQGINFMTDSTTTLVQLSFPPPMRSGWARVAEAAVV
jgi:hypothetical protein